MPATVTFVDIAGLVSGASQGEGLGNQFLSHIRSCNAICQVVRAFSDPNVQHVDMTHDPQKDIDVVNTELILADLQTIEKRLPKIQKEARANPKLRPEAEALQNAKSELDNGTPLFALGDEWRAKNQEILTDLHLLTMKSIIYLFNVDEDTLADENKQQKLQELVTPAKAIFVCAKLESELRGMSQDEAAELLETYGVDQSGLNKLIHSAYQTLGLQSYLTAGEQEVRAWTIPKGSTAPEAAGVIHGDFQKGFIAAQVINYQDLIEAGSETTAKSAGKVATVGKDYIMQDNDVVEFRFNV